MTIDEMLLKAKAASRGAALLSTAEKNAALECMAAALVENMSVAGE